MNMRPSEVLTKLSDEQKQSLDWTRSIAIRANAGSGKTTVLVQRIVQILHNHRDLNLDQIVAITFTRKAGAQLKQKLHEALSECVKSSTGDDDARFWRDRLDELPRCPIGTIDSLCHRLLKDAIEAGLIGDLDPAFGILDGIDRSELLDQALRRTEIELKDETAAAHDAWSEWLKTQSRYDLNRALRSLLAQAVAPSKLAATVAQRLNPADPAVLRVLDLPALNHPLNAMRKDREPLLTRMKRALDEMLSSPQARKPTQGFQKAVDYLATTIANANSLSDVQFVQSLRSNLFTKTDGTVLKSGLENKGTAYFPLLNAIQQDWQKWMPDWNFDFDCPDGFELTERLAAIYEVAHRQFRTLCDEENRYDFGFLAERTVALLDDARRSAALIEHYRFILVDEFQDTNELQWRIVAGLAGVDPEKPVITDKLMIVGDPQQSIYRFRAADPTVFERVIELIRRGNIQEGRAKQPTAYDQCDKGRSNDEQREGLMRLKKNYRSHDPLPLRLIDKLSVHAFNQVKYRDPQNLEAGLNADNRAEVVYVLPGERSEADEGAGDERNASDNAESTDSQAAVESLDPDQLDLVARELIAQHEHGFAWKEMAILLRSRATHLVNLEDVLRSYRIPYQLVGGLGFWQRQEVRDLVSLASCLANGADELALFAVLRGPLCGLNDSELLFLSTLGGRKLLNGLHRFATIQRNDCDWSEFHLEEATIKALREALTHRDFTAERKQFIQRAAERLEYDGTWRQRVDRMPHSELLLAALDESGAWAVYADEPEGERRLANLRQFFEVLQALESGRAASLADTARRLKKLVDSSTQDEEAELPTEDNDAVQVMTVHAAKGLQYKVVAVIGLERQFKADADSVMLLDRFQHLCKDDRDSDLGKKLHGLPVISFRDPEMPMTRIHPLLHQALGKIERKLTIAEEARIFHVAITRAECVLILAGAAPRGKNWPRNNTWQKWVHGALGLTRDIGDGRWQDPADDSLRLRIVRTRTDAATRPLKTEKADPEFDLDPIREMPTRRTIAATTLEKMREAFRDHPEEWAMRYRYRVSPRSGSIPGQLIDGKVLKADDETGKHVGTLVHRALEMGSAFPKGAKERRALLLAHAAALSNDRGFDADEPGSATDDAGEWLPAQIANAAEKILTHVLPNNPFKGLLEAEGESEVDFALPIGSWIITGRFDRLIEAKGGSWEIVDWKTDDMTIDAIVTKYGEQMKLYALALYESLPVKPAEIVVHLAMTSARESRRLVFAAEQLQAYRKELERTLPPI